MLILCDRCSAGNTTNPNDTQLSLGVELLKLRGLIDVILSLSDI
jgi:hypothetical protein